MPTICTDVELLNILSIFKGLIQFATIVVPVILVIFVIIDIIKTISSGDVDTKKLFKSISKRLIAAVLVFLVPFIIEIALNILPTQNLYYLDCYKNASSDAVLSIAKSNADEVMNKLDDAMEIIYREKDFENVSKIDYDNAHLLYQLTGKEVRLIPDKDVREKYEEKLKDYKGTLNKVKKSI